MNEHIEQFGRVESHVNYLNKEPAVAVCLDNTLRCELELAIRSNGYEM